jgi:hypothetical protein
MGSVNQRFILASIALAIVSSSSAFAADACGSFKAGSKVTDLSPPKDFVDACSRHSALCHRLTAGYPPSAKTLAYFVTEKEWQEYRAGTRDGFTRYLIAQSAERTPASDFANLKRYIRSRQGDIPDHTRLPSVLQSEGRANLGILEESEDAIVSGVVMKVSVPPPGPTRSISLASSNTAFLSKGELFSLYVFVEIPDAAEPSAVKALTKEWLSCLRKTNRG